ncbi:MAG: hypothetical protein NTW03_06835, partial [Verrucomicrobia bacterium]|nr:hypothetical protein [Verrucomicrobiota bacterium]
MLEYLGDPVEPPAPLDPRYSKAGLSAAIQSAARAAGITLQSVEFDDSEYPFLIGVVCQKGDFPKLREQVRRLNGYEDHGSVGSQVCNTMNIVPWRTYPAEASQRIERRITLRQQIFLEKLRQERS